MTVAAKPKVTTLEDYAYRAIQKHSKKTLKWEKSVKKDEDPEALHQMRVGMRRLRAIVSNFDFVVNLPKVISDRNISKIGRHLGKLRDLDVLKDTIEKNYQPSLPPQEVEYLQAAYAVLKQQRENAVADVKTTLKNTRYLSLKEAFDEWLEKPSYEGSASLPIELVVPDLLLPEISNFFLHPGWQIGMQLNKSSGMIYHQSWTNEEIEQHLTSGSEHLHSLRKQAKGLRYQMELFADLYGESYGEYVTQVKNIQDILGEIQDTVVLGEWFKGIFNSELAVKLPTLVNLLVEKRRQLWHRWYPIQERYMQAETRNRFHMAVIKGEVVQD
jgi:CHAD domain-containing protein